MTNFEDNTSEKIFTPNLGLIALCFLISLAGFGYILATLPEIMEEIPIATLKLV